ncbi:MAG: hypothetical protein JWM80_2624, partial [Cyanobacteria bacterium RYN_339]|nr:hypothetical protein [Cyanobacteria bacterium RYN_339]
IFVGLIQTKYQGVLCNRNTYSHVYSHRLGDIRGEINDVDATQVLKVYRALGNGPNVSRAKLALERWSDAFERLSDDDKLVDYWIGLESLFIGVDTGELSYRAALRIAWFLGADATDRRRLQKEMKSSYGARSKIVHGSGKRPKDFESIFGQTELALHSALMKVILMSEQFDPETIEGAIFDALDK